jgi:hypothetical protein
MSNYLIFMFFLTVDIGLFIVYSSLKKDEDLGLEVELKTLILNLAKLLTTVLIITFVLHLMVIIKFGS